MNRDQYKSHLINILNKFDYEFKSVLPSQFAEDNRVMSSATTPIPGRFSFENTPYSKEILDCGHPDHPARIIAIMKSAQSGISTGVLENFVAWVIAESPGNVMWLSANEKLMEEAMTNKFEEVIDSCGLRKYIGIKTTNKKNRRTGDTSKSKDFAGGKLFSGGLNALSANMRQRSIRYGIIDDFDAAKYTEKAGGSVRSLIESRFTAYYNKMKLFYISTAELKGSSNIEDIFLKGDQRYFHWECPSCGERIDLQWRIKVSDDNYAGITYKLDKNHKLIDSSVGYICQKCGHFIQEKHKHKLNLSGKWIPTAEPSEPGIYSYHLNALYNPTFSTPWIALVRKWIDIHPIGQPINVEELHTFVNTVLGQTYEQRSKPIKTNNLRRQSRQYTIGTVPVNLAEKDGNGKVVMITCGSDLNGKIDDARLDYEIVAHCENGATYSVTHGSVGTFKKSRKETASQRDNRVKWTYRNNATENNVWTEFQNIVMQQLPTDDGSEMNIMITGVDTGQFTVYAYNFINSMPSNVIGLKGDGADSFRKKDKDNAYFTQSKENMRNYLVDVNLVKDVISGHLELKWEDEALAQPANYCNFPVSKNGKYTYKDFYSHYEAEHKVAEEKNGNTSFLWIKRSSSVENHLWDCRVYNFALREVLANAVCRESKIYKGGFNEYVSIILG